MGRCLILFALWMTFPSILDAGEVQRAAFVVGNAAYDHAPDLENPGRDASLISATLRSLDFSVTEVHDASRAELTAAFAAFLKESIDAKVTLLYFAGHGMQFEGRNYLLGRDARLQSEFDIGAETLPLDRMVDMMRENSRAALVFIDACRNNPLADTFYAKTQNGTRSLMTRGLAAVRNSSEGAMLVFAASPGQVAYDGISGNSPFAEALAEHLPAPGMEVLSLMKRVMRDVRTATGNRQVPVVTNDLTAEIFLGSFSADQATKSTEPGAIAPTSERKPLLAVPTSASQVGTTKLEFAWLEKRRADIQSAYGAALLENSVSGYRRFIFAYPHGEKAETARETIDMIEARQLARLSDRAWDGGTVRPVSAVVAARAEQKWGLTSRELRRVQLALNKRGFGAGAEDGVAGPQTRGAVAAFQASVGLFATGAVSRLTARKLGVRY